MRLVRFPNQLVVQVTLVLVFTMERDPAPAVTVQGIFVAIAHVLKQSDESFRRALCAVWCPRDDVGLDPVDVALQVVDHAFNFDVCPICWGLACEAIPIETHQQLPRPLLDLVEVDGRTSPRWHCLTQARVDRVAVHGKPEHGGFEVPLHDALLWSARLCGVLHQIESEVLGERDRAESRHDVSYLLWTAHAPFSLRGRILPIQPLCYGFQLAVQEVFDAWELRRMTVAQQRHVRGKWLGQEATVKLIKNPLSETVSQLCFFIRLPFLSCLIVLFFFFFFRGGRRAYKNMLAGHVGTTLVG